MIRRREFIAGIGNAAAWPLAARAQQGGKLPAIGYLGGGNMTGESRFTAAFLQRMRELGWIEGRNIAIEYRWTEGSSERGGEIATEFVHLKVDVIVASGANAALAAKRATSVIPIVFPVALDPVGVGLVASLARPGGNVTGLTNQLTDLAGKRVELLREVVPGLRHLAIMVMASPTGDLEVGEVQIAAGKLGLELVTLKIGRTEDIALAFDALKDRADALYIGNSLFFLSNQMLFSSLALRARLPTMCGEPSWGATGGLVAYGASFSGRFRRSAEFVDMILRGTKPADIPVEQPTKFELVVNLVTAKAIGLMIPESFLFRADEVIE
jgi:putative tryptophan/tyrosine transport system substrate-binding protein